MQVIKIDEKICTGCQECVKVCPVYAIEGELHKPQKINPDRCVMCGQCVQKCKSYVSVLEQGEELYHQIKEERHLPQSVNEPLFAAYNECHLREITEALHNPDIMTMVQCAPAVHVALAEDFGYEFGTLSAGKMAAALRAVGFDRVYNTNFSADLTIMEEGTELIERVTKKGVLPMFTSCCPAWVKYLEQNFPELKDHLSSCKSPQQMMGTVMKTYGGSINEKDAKNIYSVSVMPCTCKEFECNRPEMKDSGYRDVDVVMTTRELAWLIKEAKIDFSELPEEEFDSVLGTYSGAGAIFGVTGGVMEAALRTGYEWITGQAIEQIEIAAVRGTEEVRISDIRVGELTLRVGVVTGLSYVEDVLNQIIAGDLQLDFLEVMTCPQGCISGGGQPKLLMDTEREEAYQARRNAIYQFDRELPVRKSHENSDIKKLYDEFLEKPNSEKAHHLLHTEYCIK